MYKRYGCSRPFRMCRLAVEQLEDRCVPSTLLSATDQVSATDQAPSGEPATFTPDQGGTAQRAVAGTASPDSGGTLGEAGNAGEGNHSAGPGHTDSPASGGQQGVQEGAGNNQSGPQEGQSQNGKSSARPRTATRDTGRNLDGQPAANQADEASNPADLFVKNDPGAEGAGTAASLPPTNSSNRENLTGAGNNADSQATAVVYATPGPQGTVTFLPPLAGEQRLPPQPPQEVDGTSPPVSGKGIGASPQTAEVVVSAPATPLGQGGESSPESSLQDRLVPRLAGELQGTLLVDAAVLQSGLRRFLDQLSALGAPATGPEPAPSSLSWLGRVPGLLPWLGAAAAATVTLELARRRLRTRPKSGFASPGNGCRWDWVTGRPIPPPDEEP